MSAIQDSPGKDLAGQLSAAAGEAFAKLGLDPALGAMRRSDRPDLADFQCNGAMAAAKKLGKNPRELATSIVEALTGHELVASSEVAGPGFINIKLTAAGLARQAEAIAKDKRAGRGACCQRAARGDGFRRLERRQADACGPPALDHHRGRPAAALPLHGRSGDVRRAPRRLGAADGAARSTR